MIRFAAEEDFNNDAVRALRRSLPDVDIVGVEAEREGLGLMRTRKRGFFADFALAVLP